MTRVHHLNCGYLQVPPNPKVGCHCLLLEDPAGLALVDTGIGLLDVQNPTRRIGRETIDLAGFQFREEDTAIRQIEKLGFQSEDVKHIVLTHGDPDHAGGLADFPNAIVHISTEELENISNKNARYRSEQFDHKPRWRAYDRSIDAWFGLQVRPLDLGFDSPASWSPLFGHTHGHCGVAVQEGERWLLHVGDAYYLRVELETDDHPVSQLATLRADDDAGRRASIKQLRRLQRVHAVEIEMFGYHDLSEMRVQ